MKNLIFDYIKNVKWPVKIIVVLLGLIFIGFPIVYSVKECAALEVSFKNLIQTQLLLYICFLVIFLLYITSLIHVLRIAAIEQSAREEAETANKAKTAFLNNMSHDIRTPMNAIMGYTELAARDYKDPEKVLMYMKKASSASNHLLSLINNILDISHIESGKTKVVLRPENIDEMIKQIHDIVISDAEDKNLELTIDSYCIIHKKVLCDKLRINQVLLNILSNSIKYTQSGGHISVRVSELQQVGPRSVEYEFRIKDDGIGIKKDFINSIFEPFARENDNYVAAVQGSGLGLTITKKCVEMMSGRIAVRSEEGKGTETVIVIPMKVSDSEILTSDSIYEDTVKSIRGTKILLVDDNDFNRDIAKLMLENEGIIVDEAVNGEVALSKMRMAQVGDYDLILMDIQMPVMNGYEATKRIRNLENRELSNIPIIAMTANAFEEDKKESLNNGMNDHLAKPIDIESLKKVLVKFI